MNSKKLGILVVLLALLTALFVSCNSDVADNSAVAAGSKELVYATFDNSSKGITVDTVVGYKTYDELYWFYTATKTDSFGTTGQTSDLVPVRVVDDEPAQGLSGRVGPFSQGSWSFTLYAYDDKDKTNLYYQGSTSPDVTLRNGVDNYIPVTVTPQGDYGYIAFYNDTSTTDTYFEWNDNKGGNGALRLDITLKDSNNVVYNCVSKSLTKGEDNKYKIDGRISKTATDDKFAVGVYTATFKVVNPSDSSVVFTSQDLSLRVYGNLETQLKGSLTEIVDAYGYFQVPEQQINVFIATAEAVTQTVDIAPEKYKEGTTDKQKTTVEFEATALDTTNSQHSLKVEVTPITTAPSKYVVEGGETAVAGIDFELKKIVTTTVGDVTTTEEKTVTKFENNKYATIETYIAKGFETVTVVYTGDSSLDQPIANELATPTNVATIYTNDTAMGDHLGYSQASGLLRFKTNHFSEYYVKASVEAINVTTNTVYTTLAEAVAAVDTKQTIQLIKDVTLSDPLEVSKSDKTITLDLNGKTLSGRVNLKAGSLTIKNGTIAGGDKQPLNVYGSSSTDAVNYSVLTVESNVTVTGNEFAVCLFGNTATSNGYGAVVNFYGNASTTGTGKEGAIFVSGNLGKDKGLAEQNNIINIYGSVTSTNDAALALNGNALVNIFEGASLTGNTALTVKRGKLVVAGGTITSNGAKKYPPSANNNGTEMTGAGVSVTATYNKYGPLAVEISGGTFVSANADAVFKADQTYQNVATISITGGVFSSDPSEYVADGYYAKANTPVSGRWTVLSLADEYGDLFAGGNGTKNKPYLISTPDQWNNFYQVVYECNLVGRKPYFELKNNINLTGFDIKNYAISSSNEKKYGYYMSFVLDGKGYEVGKIENLKGYCQLFPYPKDATIENITINYNLNETRSAGMSYSSYGDVYFTNVVTTGQIKTSANWASAFVLYPQNSNVYYTQCINRANLTTNFTSNSYVAPFGSHNGASGAKVYFDRCENHGNIAGGYVGGFVGMGNNDHFYFKDTDAVKNYGSLTYSANYGHFQYGNTSDKFKTNNTNIECTVKQTGSSVQQLATITVNNPTDGQKLIINNIAGATRYVVTVSSSIHVYNYDNEGNKNKWSGSFPRSITSEYSAESGATTATAFINVPLKENRGQRLDYQTGTQVSYNGLFVDEGFDINSSDVKVLLGDREKDPFVLVEYKGNVFYYFMNGSYYGLLSDGATGIQLRFSVTAYNGDVVVGALSSYSYTYPVSAN